MQNTYLEAIFSRFDEATRQALDQFAGLSAAQLNWKPAPERWSIAQCLDHLIVTNEAYFPELDAIARGVKRRTFWEGLPWWPSFVGRMLLRVNAEGATRRVRNPGVFAPAQSDLRADIVDRFRTHNEELKDRIRRTDTVDHDQMIITSPAGPYAVYSLRDACTILALHEHRHLGQARRVREAEGFPGQ